MPDPALAERAWPIDTATGPLALAGDRVRTGIVEARNRRERRAGRIGQRSGDGGNGQGDQRRGTQASSVNLCICIPRSCHWYKDSSPVERCPTAAKRTPTGDRPPAGSAHLQRRDSQRSGREWTVASDNRPASRTQAEADQRSKRRISADAHPGRPFRRPRAASSRHAGVPAIVPPGPAAGTCVESVISRHSPHGGPRAQAPRAITPPRPGPSERAVTLRCIRHRRCSPYAYLRLPD